MQYRLRCRGCAVHDGYLPIRLTVDGVPELPTGLSCVRSCRFRDELKLRRLHDLRMHSPRRVRLVHLAMVPQHSKVHDVRDGKTSVARNVRSVELCARMAWLRNEASGTLAVTEFHNLSWTRPAPGNDVGRAITMFGRGFHQQDDRLSVRG